jgi:probable rRNA maturation factor
MEIQVANRQNEIETDSERIAVKARKILNALACPDGELSIALVGDEEIRALNWRYLKRRGSTNVLAFPMREGEFGDLHPNLLGDVVISLPTARREAEDAGISLEAMADRLLVHGILHLFGYDHDKNDLAAREMEERSQGLLALLA